MQIFQVIKEEEIYTKHNKNTKNKNVTKISFIKSVQYTLLYCKSFVFWRQIMYQPKVLSIKLWFFGNSLDNLGLETDTQVHFSCV